MLRKIEMGWARRQWLESLKRSTLSNICFIFVPGHVGVKGDEKADQLAATATVGSGRAMDRSDVLNALREVGRANDSVSEDESTSLTRMLEHQVKRGKARHERYAGSQRRMVNQHRTGVVSRYMLRDILGKKSEHLWTELSDVPYG